ncbi:MAG: hypothetical protein HYZ53_15455 [Planctomycetes bacterium]|nr:hypothetical protein [Planctomycetota bacterium]
MSIEDRVAALEELFHRPDRSLAECLVAALERGDLESDWRDVLLLGAECVEVRAVSLRARLGRALRRHCLCLRDDSRAKAVGPLCAGLRRYASLMPLAELPFWLEFLRPEDRVETRQVALQSLVNVLATEGPPPARPDLARVRARVLELAEKFLDPELVGTPENAALGLNAFCAAAALAEEGTVALARKLVELRRPFLLRQAVRLLEPVGKEWKRLSKEGRCAAGALRVVRRVVRMLRAGGGSK